MVQEQQQVVLKASATPQGMAEIASKWMNHYSDMKLYTITWLLETGEWVIALTLRCTPSSDSKATLALVPKGGDI
jgi:hypothetical protein